MTKLCVPIMVDSAEQALADAHAAKTAGADLVELRLDRFADDPNAAADLVKATARCLASSPSGPSWEGVASTTATTSHRVALIEHIGINLPRPGPGLLRLSNSPPTTARPTLGTRSCSSSTTTDQPRPTDTGLILSSHDFEHPARRPYPTRQGAMAELPEPAAWSSSPGRARSLRDNLEAFETHRPAQQADHRAVHGRSRG